MSEPEKRIVVAPGFLEKVTKSYSADRISEKQPVRPPFSYGGKLYISTGGFSVSGQPPVEKCYELVPENSYTGLLKTYSAPRGREYMEYYESLRNDPNGFYHGMIVEFKKQRYAMVGPEVIFTTNKKGFSKAEKTRVEKPRQLALF